MRLLISFIYWEVRYINAIHFLFSSPAITFVGGGRADINGIFYR